MNPLYEARIDGFMIAVCAPNWDAALDILRGKIAKNDRYSPTIHHLHRKGECDWPLGEAKLCTRHGIL